MSKKEKCPSCDTMNEVLPIDCPNCPKCGCLYWREEDVINRVLTFKTKVMEEDLNARIEQIKYFLDEVIIPAILGKV